MKIHTGIQIAKVLFQSETAQKIKTHGAQSKELIYWKFWNELSWARTQSKPEQLNPTLQDNLEFATSGPSQNQKNPVSEAITVSTNFQQEDIRLPQHDTAPRNPLPSLRQLQSTQSTLQYRESRTTVSANSQNPSHSRSELQPRPATKKTLAGSQPGAYGALNGARTQRVFE